MSAIAPCNSHSPLSAFSRWRCSRYQLARPVVKFTRLLLLPDVRQQLSRKYLINAAFRMTIKTLCICKLRVDTTHFAVSCDLSGVTVTLMNPRYNVTCQHNCHVFACININVNSTGAVVICVMSWPNVLCAPTFWKKDCVTLKIPVESQPCFVYIDRRCLKAN